MVLCLFNVTWFKLTIWSPVVTICTASLTFNNSTFYPHSIFMCFVCIWEQTAIISLYSINWLVWVTETECVYCAVRVVICGLNVPAPTQYLKRHTCCTSTGLACHVTVHCCQCWQYVYRLQASTYIQQYVHQTDMTTDNHTHSSLMSGAPTADEQWYSVHGQSQRGSTSGLGIKVTFNLIWLSRWWV